MRCFPSALFALIASLLVALGLVVLGCNSSGGISATSDFCSAIASYAKTCNLNDPCSKATVDECETLASNRSAQALAAYTGCVQSATCGDGGAGAAECYLQKTATLTPTATQTTLAQDYCSACPGNETLQACESNFYGAAGVQLGGPILTVSDSIVTNIDFKCIPGLSADAGGPSGSCEAAFVLCVDQTILTAAPEPAACTVSSAADGG
jgi:hypothetical protein